MTEAPLTVADPRAPRPGVHDAESFQRMEDYFIDIPVFDAVAYIPHTSCTTYVTEPIAS